MICFVGSCPRIQAGSATDAHIDDRLDVPVAKILGARRYRQKREVYECHKVVAQALGEEIAVGLIHWVSLSFLVGVLCLD